MRCLAAAVLLSLSAPAGAPAGIPTEGLLKCPVGGEAFMVTGTTSCTVMGRTMSFRPYTSCDYITRLPVCPSNGLPLYREFTGAEVESLSRLVRSEDYRALRARSKWQRAYAVAGHLKDAGTTAGFNLMLGFFWYETDAFLQSSSALADFLLEVRAELAGADAQEVPVIQAIAAYALFLAGNAEEAESFLKAARSAEEIPAALDSYLDRIEACSANMDAPDCGPEARIEF